MEQSTTIHNKNWCCHWNLSCFEDIHISTENTVLFNSYSDYRFDAKKLLGFSSAAGPESFWDNLQQARNPGKASNEYTDPEFLFA